MLLVGTPPLKSRISFYTFLYVIHSNNTFSAVANFLHQRRSRPRRNPKAILYIIQTVPARCSPEPVIHPFRPAQKTVPASNVLTNYVAAWEQFLPGARYNSHVLSDINRYWVARQRAEGVKDVWPLDYGALFGLEETMFLMSLKAELVDAMKAERDSAVLKRAEESYEVLKKGSGWEGGEHGGFRGAFEGLNHHGMAQIAWPKVHLCHAHLVHTRFL